MMFEFLVLETFQAGLSWITILLKRENFRVAFDHFNCEKIANYTEEKIQELLQDAGIIRNPMKIRAAVSNAKAFGRTTRIRQFLPLSLEIHRWKNGCEYASKSSDAPATTPLPDAISKDLKKRL